MSDVKFSTSDLIYPTWDTVFPTSYTVFAVSAYISNTLMKFSKNRSLPSCGLDILSCAPYKQKSITLSLFYIFTQHIVTSGLCKNMITASHLCFMKPAFHIAFFRTFAVDERTFTPYYMFACGERLCYSPWHWWVYSTL